MMWWNRKLKHDHEWVILAVARQEYTSGVESVIHEKCACGEIRARTIDGYWTLEMLNAEV